MKFVHQRFSICLYYFKFLRIKHTQVFDLEVLDLGFILNYVVVYECSYKRDFTTGLEFGQNLAEVVIGHQVVEFNGAVELREEFLEFGLFFGRAEVL